MRPGEKLGPFVIEKEIGSGAMGTVFRAQFTEGERARTVAIKIIATGLASNESALARFEREAAILKQLKHPHIVRLFATGRYKGTPFFAMEFVEGESMDRLLERQGRLEWRAVIAYARQLCLALQHAHEKGIIHRDLKPSNLMLLSEGGVLKLTDFGIAKDTDVTALTGANSTIGTAAYMSPEQCRGERNLSHKSDLYSLGVVLYELLTGKKPFVAESPVEMFLLHVNGKFERPHKVFADIPRRLDVLVSHLLEKRPDQRPLDALTVGHVLGEIEKAIDAEAEAARMAALGGPTTEYTASRPAGGAKADAKKKAGKRKKPTPIPRWAQALALAAAIGGLIGAALLFTRPDSPEVMLGRIKVLEDVKTRTESQDEQLYAAVRAYLSAYGSRVDPETERLRLFDRDRSVGDQERVLHRRYDTALLRRSADDFPPPEAYKAFMDALDAETEGDLFAAGRIYRGMAERYPRTAPDDALALWGGLATRKLARLSEAEQLGAVLRPQLEEAWLTETERSYAAEPIDLALTAARYEILGDPARARGQWARLRDKFARDLAERRWFLLATGRARSLAAEVAGRKPDEDKAARIKLLGDTLDKAKELKDSAEFKDRKQARNLCRELRDLYGGDPDPAAVRLAREAEKLLPTIRR